MAERGDEELKEPLSPSKGGPAGATSSPYDTGLQPDSRYAYKQSWTWFRKLRPSSIILSALAFGAGPVSSCLSFPMQAEQHPGV